MMSTIFHVTLSDIPEETEAVCPENEKITNIQTTAGRYQKYFRIILNIKLLYLSPPLILSIINSVTKAPACIRAGTARYAVTAVSSPFSTQRSAYTCSKKSSSPRMPSLALQSLYLCSYSHFCQQSRTAGTDSCCLFFFAHDHFSGASGSSFPVGTKTIFI